MDRKINNPSWCIERIQEKIEDYKSELINKNQENAKQQDQEFKNVLNNLENLYNSNKDKWINEIVERCLK